jgi:hypothetical protein
VAHCAPINVSKAPVAAPADRAVIHDHKPLTVGIEDHLHKRCRAHDSGFIQVSSDKLDIKTNPHRNLQRSRRQQDESSFISILAVAHLRHRSGLRL